MNLTALCCLLAILSSRGALLLDFLGLKQGRMAIFLLHGSAALFSASAAAAGFSLSALTRHNLCTAQKLQPLGLSLWLKLLLLLSLLAPLQPLQPARAALPWHSSNLLWPFALPGSMSKRQTPAPQMKKMALAMHMAFLPHFKERLDYPR